MDRQLDESLTHWPDVLRLAAVFGISERVAIRYVNVAKAFLEPIVGQHQYCLVYDRPLTDRGLTWCELVGWWAEQHRGPATEREHALSLYDRLVKSLDNKAETYCFAATPALGGRAADRRRVS